MQTTSRPSKQGQRGAATLTLVLVLALAGGLGALAMVRALWVEHRGMALQTRTVLAHEAAQFGLDRAQAVLNEPRAIDANCRHSLMASAAAGAASAADVLSRWLTSAPPAAAGIVLACARSSAGWTCDCSGAAALNDPTSFARIVGDREAFVAEAAAAVHDDPIGPISLQVSSCDEGGVDCARRVHLGESPGTASARLAIDLIRRPALVHWPAATLSAGGAVHLGDGAVVRHDDAGGSGLAVQAGSVTQAPGARVEGLPGSPRHEAIVLADPMQAPIEPDARLAHWLGLRFDAWSDLPRVGRIECRERRCDGADLLAAWRAGHRLIAVRGDLGWRVDLHRLDADPAGMAPLLLVVDGELELTGTGDLHGVLVARSMRIAAGPSTLSVTGAVASASDVRVDGSVLLSHRADLVRAAATRAAAVLRQNGSWRERPLP